MNRLPRGAAYSIVMLLAIFQFAGCAKKAADTPQAIDSTQAKPATEVKIVPAEDGPAFPSAKLTIVSPREGQVLTKIEDSVGVIMTVSGMDLAKATDGDSTKGIAYSKQGQHVHVIVDEKPYMADYKNGQPFFVGVLAPGKHTIRAFPSRSWHESVKVAGAFATRTFYVGKGPAKGVKDTTGPDLKGPMLTYSRPKGTYTAAEGSKLLLDFFIANARLGSADYKVGVTIDGRDLGLLSEWKPYYITGLATGKHTIELRLLDTKGAVVPGAFNSPKGEITIQ